MSKSCGLRPLITTPSRTSLASSSPLVLQHAATNPTTCVCSIHSRGQVRHATFIRRPRRPYTFTQLVQLSDGSTYTVRTTSPQPIYRATKDTRNTLLWNPSEKTLRNVELDEAGKLAAFRERFGRAFDARKVIGGEDGAAAADGEAGRGQVSKKAAEAKDGVAEEAGAEAFEDGAAGFADLISGYASQDVKGLKDPGAKKGPVRRR